VDNVPRIDGYKFDSVESSDSHEYLYPAVIQALSQIENKLTTK
jgi:hypothetical protein